MVLFEIFGITFLLQFNVLKNSRNIFLTPCIKYRDDIYTIRNSYIKYNEKRYRFSLMFLKY